MKNALLTISAALLTCSGMFAANPALISGPTPRLVQNDTFKSILNTTTSTVRQGSTRATGSIDYTWAGDPYSATGFQNMQTGYVVYQAFQVDPTVLSKLSGNKVSAITLTNGSNESQTDNPYKEVTMFLTTELGQEPFYTQDVTRSNEAFRQQTFELDTPQDFDASKPLYVGYKFTLTDINSYYIVFDGIPTTNPSSLIAISTDGSTPAAQSWANYGTQIGSLCIGCTFTGDNLPGEWIIPGSVSCPGMSELDSEPEYVFSFTNMGANKIESMNIHVEVTGETPYDIPFQPGENVPTSKQLYLRINGNKYTSTGEKTVKISVDKVNDIANQAADAVVSAKTFVFSGGYPRVGLYEVGTGTWCGWCPSSLAALGHIKDQYEGKVIGIEYHGSNGPQAKDPMANSYCDAWFSYIGLTGFPFPVFNRAEQGAIVSGHSYKNWNDLDDQLNACVNSKSLCQSVVTGYTPIDDKTGKVNASFRFAENVPSENYLVSLVVVQDNVGPYNQTNYYAAAYGQGLELFGWEKEGRTVKYTYDEVCIFNSNCAGQAITTDATLNKGQDYNVEFDVNISKAINKDKDPNFDPSLRAIAIITDKATGEVLNASDMRFSKSAVKGIMSEVAKPQIVLGEGSISISNAANAAIYTLDGVKVADGSASGLAKGIYVVKADNLVKKVMVK